ncbi:MAG: N-acetylmuramoyl-L-alanine amidase, partial [Paracoccus sp. (in: a-proteobacteria)]|nr:N-acetylmuramoyl-L-alanine amidase [Paracoccus sp. (in: a-proteobacteria)]
GLPGGAAGWQAMSVSRAGTVYDLARQSLPGGLLQPGDQVVIPQAVPHSCQGEIDQVAAGLAAAPRAASAQGAGAQAAAAAAPAAAVTASASCSTTVVFVLDPGHGGRAARSNFAEAARRKPYDDALAAGTITQADHDRMFDVAGSYFNNAIGAISNIMEKTMTHRLMPLIEQKINARKDDIIRRDPHLDDIEVHLTKTDEMVNMTGADRAAVARDKEADFFLCCHFNAQTLTIGGDGIFVNLDITRVAGVVDKGHSYNISQTAGHLGGTYPKTAITRNASRGPLILHSNNKQMPSDVLSKITVVGGAVASDLAAAIQSAENSARPVTDGGIRAQGLANVSPVNLGMTTGHRKIVPIYLEADFINVESGDRLWNTAAYNANLPTAHARWNIPPEPAATDAKAAWRQTHLHREMPPLPAGHDMFDKAADTIAATLLANMNHRIC